MLVLTLTPETWLHRWPVGLKFALLALVSFVIFQRQTLVDLLPLLVFVLGLYASLGRTAFSRGLAFLKPIGLMLAIILLFHVFYSSLEEGLRIAGRILLLLMLANLVTLTSRLDQMIDFVDWLLTPLRRFGKNPRIFSLAIALVIRFTPELVRKGGMMREAWRSRSAKRTGWRILLPFCLVALDDADRVAEALKARGGVSWQLQNKERD